MLHPSFEYWKRLRQENSQRRENPIRREPRVYPQPSTRSMRPKLGIYSLSLLRGLNFTEQLLHVIKDDGNEYGQR